MTATLNDLLVLATPANGVTVIAVDFMVEDEAWLEVYNTTQREVALTLGVDYTFTGEGTETGYITLTTPANGTDNYAIYMVQPLERTEDLQFRGDLRSPVINLALDRIWRRLQYHYTLLTRAVLLAPSSILEKLYLPEPDAGKTLVWNETNDGFVNSVLVADEVAAAAAASAAAAAADAATAAAEAAAAAADAADALQAAIDAAAAEAAALAAQIAAEAAQAAAEAAQAAAEAAMAFYLPLAGGSMTGAIVMTAGNEITFKSPDDLTSKGMKLDNDGHLLLDSVNVSFLPTVDVTASRNFLVSDIGKHLFVDASLGAVALTDIDLPAGAIIPITIVDNTNAVTIVAGAGKSINGVATGTVTMTLDVGSSVSYSKQSLADGYVTGTIDGVA